MRTPFARSASTPILPVALAAALSVATSDAVSQPQQQPPPPGQQPPVFRTEANFVRVDVYPMKGGQPLQGLTAEDFELFEDGVLQKIESVEHVQVRPAGAQSTRIDPGSQREALQQAANPRNRVFVIFLDIPNVSLPGA